jgi:hypothetical protein
MKDLQPFKSSLMTLTYEEKIQMSEWLHTQIDLERGEYVKKKGAEVTEKIGSFLDKATELTKGAANSLSAQFRTVDNNSDNNGPEKR